MVKLLVNNIFNRFSFSSFVNVPSSLVGVIPSKNVNIFCRSFQNFGLRVGGVLPVVASFLLSSFIIWYVSSGMHGKTCWKMKLA